MSNYIIHYGIKGQRHGIRRFQNEDGSLTPAGKDRYQTKSGVEVSFDEAEIGGGGGNNSNKNKSNKKSSSISSDNQAFVGANSKEAADAYIAEQERIREQNKLSNKVKRKVDEGKKKLASLSKSDLPKIKVKDAKSLAAKAKSKIGF